MTYQGTIVFSLTNKGSKSEKLMPFLYVGQGTYLEIWKADDESFLGDRLVPYDGKQVTIHGEPNEHEVFIIQTIEQINPAAPTEEVPPIESKNNNETNNTSTEE